MDYPLVRAEYILRWCQQMSRWSKPVPEAIKNFVEKYDGKTGHEIADDLFPNNQDAWAQLSWDQIEIDLFGATTARLLARSYAPGGYWRKCSQCGTQFTADKRAGRCLSCAKHEWDVTVQE